MTCDRCGGIKEVVKTRVFPVGFSPPPGRRCKCAHLCRDCRDVAIIERAYE